MSVADKIGRKDMRIGLYFRQAWYGLRTNRVFSAVYIIGTAVSLALVMAFLTVLSTRIVNTAPENYRNRTLVVHNITVADGGSITSGFTNERFGEDFLKGIPQVELWSVKAVNQGFEILESEDGEVSHLFTSFVGQDFWKIFGFEFLYGRPISGNGMNVNTPEAVVSESAAVRLAGRADAVGETFLWKDMPVRICGVVRDVPMSATLAFSEIWLPSTLLGLVLPESVAPMQRYLGSGQIVILAQSPEDMDVIKKELESRIGICNARSEDGVILELTGISSQRQYIFAWSELKGRAYTWLSVGVVLLILLVPLLNLSSMVNSRMEARLAEFGTRKAFGARGGAIVSQVFWENLTMTFIGAALGLLLSWVLLALFSRQLNLLVPSVLQTMISSLGGQPQSGYFDFRDFFSPGLYALLLLILIVLNLASALVPAIKVIRRPITDSLNSKK